MAADRFSLHPTDGRPDTDLVPTAATLIVPHMPLGNKGPRVGDVSSTRGIPTYPADAFGVATPRRRTTASSKMSSSQRVP